MTSYARDAAAELRSFDRPGAAVTRRAALGGLGIGAAALGLGAGGGKAAPADATAMATHPIVGTWVTDFDPDHPGALVFVTTFHADGTMTEIHPLGGPGIGSWRPTGERTGDQTIKFQNITDTPGTIVPGTVTFWGPFTLDESGDSWTSEGVVELRASDGAVVARFPFVGVSPAQRLRAEPPPPLGTPEPATPTA